MGKAIPENRYGRVKASETITSERVAAYLPSNYEVDEVADGYVRFSGIDFAGWTLDGYVLPRLASGLIFAEEVSG